jgi:hypothetical protein
MTNDKCLMPNELSWNTTWPVLARFIALTLQPFNVPHMINDTHPDYLSSFSNWQRIREVLAGEDAIKAAGERYLPRIQSQTAEEYHLYRQRASFFNATARTAEGLLGLIFRRPPFITLSVSPVPAPASTLQRFNGSTAPRSNASLDRFRQDADRCGTPFAAYAKAITHEVLTVGRVGSLLDFQVVPDDHPYVVTYKAEQILNWCVERINGYGVPTLIALSEWTRPYGALPASQILPGDPNPLTAALVEQIRVLRLVPSDTLASIKQSAARQNPAAHSSHAYIVEIWQELPSRDKLRRSKLEWALVDTLIPARNGIALPFIPFAFHGPRHSQPAIDKSPLQDLIAVNLDHYRLDADYKHGLHYTALPTAWISGFERTANLKIGSSTAWVTETPGASAGFLEFHGHGLTSFERALDRDERLMAVLGSRLLEPQKRVGETAQAIELRQSGQDSTLASIASSVSDSLTQLLRWAIWWVSTAESPHLITDQQALVRLNTDFTIKGLASDELQAIVHAWQSGAISQNTLLELLRKGEVLPDGRTNDEEIRLLKSETKPDIIEPTN